MPLSRMRFLFSLLALDCVLLPVGAWGQTAQANRQNDAAPAEIPKAPSGQMEAVYADGQLTLKVEGVPLIDVLRVVCQQMGAELDAQAQPADPVSFTRGPGAAKEILEALLKDAPVNYVLGGAATGANGIATVLILPQTQDPGVQQPSVGGEQTRQAQHDSPAPSDTVRSGASQMKELMDAAKGELEKNAGRLTIETGVDDSGSPIEIDAAAVLKQIETQLNEAQQTASSVSQNSQGDPAASGAGDSSNSPVGRPAHRKHH